ncbi:MAG: SUMF1/EgtB/PvdO family nonheme iron enzyme [Phycisphaerae bacterium]|nr:SUMF1/EgtB/PvdO family nonheme iron enzyme [Phycisphaerae bacterium]
MAHDRYSQWLGIERGDGAIDHYMLLGIERFCSDADAIDTAAHERLDMLDIYSLAGSRDSREACQEMMNEVARARVVLMNPQRREEYNRKLSGQTAAGAPQREVRIPTATREALDLYKQIVWAHLRKWRMDEHEERLLIAEAASLGIDSNTALTIARRINSKAEHIARVKQMRTAAAAILAACVVLAGVVLFFIFPPYNGTKPPESTNTLTSDVRSKQPPVSTRSASPATQPDDTIPQKGEDVAIATVVPPRPIAPVETDKPKTRPSPPLPVDIPTPKPKPIPKSPTEIAATQPSIPTAKGWPFDSAEAKRRQEAAAKKYNISPKLVLSLASNEKLAMVLIPPGEFLMGSPAGEKSREPDEHLHAVNISRPFYIGITEVTQGQWRAVMDSTPWSGRAHGRNGSALPASHIDLEGAADFCQWVSQKTGRKVRLPSEAQWEYACRSGSDGAYCFGTDGSSLDDYAWRAAPDSSFKVKYPHAVLKKKPNAFGVYDMHGNVAEWCRDQYRPDFYRNSPRIDPVHIDHYASDDVVNVYRGGSFLFTSACRSADRQSGVVPPLSSLIKHLGFRVVAEIDTSAAPVSGGATFVAKSGPAKVYTVWPFKSTEAKRRQTETAAAMGVKPNVTLSLGKNNTKMTFALIPAGEFVMGSPLSEKGRRDDETPHTVRITKPFYMAVSEVTVAQWLAVTGSRHSLGPKRLSNLPVHKVSWADALDFRNKLKQKTGLHVQLPSEAQWEYACRAGSAEAFCYGSYTSQLRYYGAHKYEGARVQSMKIQRVAQNQPNAFGLYDMHGNVYEPCRDYYDAKFYSRSPKNDPVTTTRKGGRYPTGVMRGGSWFHESRLCRSAARSVFIRGKGSDAGLRVIFSPPDKAKAAFRMVKAAAPRR